MFQIRIRLKSGRVIKDHHQLPAGETVEIGKEIEYYNDDSSITLKITNIYSSEPMPPSAVAFDEVDAVEI